MGAYVTGGVNERVEKRERNLRSFREPLRVCRVLNDGLFNFRGLAAETGKLPAKCYHKTLFPLPDHRLLHKKTFRPSTYVKIPCSFL